VSGLQTEASRQRVQLAVATALLASTLVALALASWLVADRPLASGWLAAAVTALLVCGALAGTVTVVRREAGRLLAAATAVAALAAATLVALAGTVLALGRLPRADEQAVVVPVLLGAAAGALAYRPMWSALTGATRRSTTGLRRTPDDVLAAFGDRAGRETPVEELLRQLAEALRATLGLQAAEVWTGDNAGLARLLSVPHRAAPVSSLGPADADVLRRAGVAGEAWLALWLPQLLAGRGDAQVRIAPVAHGSDLLGVLLVERPRDGERFRSADEAALGEVSRRLGVVLHNRALDAALQASLDDLRRTNAELRASRSRLVSAADAERRRIERDIHDGAQQHLAALAVNLGLARQLLADETEDRSTVVDLLAEMTGDVRETIAQVRDLAHGIYPPLLRQAGLPDALRAAAQRSAVPVTVEADGIGRRSPEVEAALYFCALEALQNVAKHAPGAAATVRLGDTADGLVLEVLDDGPGLAPAAVGAGQGIQNMTDRLGAVGGTLRWESPPGGGTLLRAVVPPVGGTP
jgi:signal transduction histidine kinase